ASLLPRPEPSDERFTSSSVLGPPMVSSDGVLPSSSGPSVTGVVTSAAMPADVPVRLVPVRALDVLVLELAAPLRLDPAEPVRRVLLLRLVVARAVVRPEERVERRRAAGLRAAGLRAAGLRRAAGFALGLLRAVAMCLLLVGEFGGNNYTRSMRVPPVGHSAGTARFLPRYVLDDLVSLYF